MRSHLKYAYIRSFQEAGIAGQGCYAGVTLARWTRQNSAGARSWRPGAAGHAGHGQRVGAHKAGFAGGDFVRAHLGRVVVSSGAGRSTQHLAQLRGRGPEALGRLRGRGDWDDRAVARQGAALRDAGECRQGDRLGGRPGHLSDPAEAAHDGVPTRGRASAAAHQCDRRGDARAALLGKGDPSLL